MIASILVAVYAEKDRCEGVEKFTWILVLAVCEAGDDMPKKVRYT
jgi:hypothetical protein